MKYLIYRIKQMVSKFIGSIPMYEIYPLETFQELSKPIIEQLKKIPRMEICEKPYAVVGDWNEFYYVQTARKMLCDKVWITVSWRLQDDGWVPYPVVQISKIVHFNPDSREGIGTIGIEHIYPIGIPKLAKLIEQIENHSEEFYHRS